MHSQIAMQTTGEHWPTNWRPSNFGANQMAISFYTKYPIYENRQNISNFIHKILNHMHIYR